MLYVSLNHSLLGKIVGRTGFSEHMVELLPLVLLNRKEELSEIMYLNLGVGLM